MGQVFTLLQILSAMCSVGCVHENYDYGYYQRGECRCADKYPFYLLTKTKVRKFPWPKKVENQGQENVWSRLKDDDYRSWVDPPAEFFDPLEKP